MSLTGRQVGTGLRDTTITIEQLSSSAQPGYPSETWTSLMEVWAHREDRMGSESMVMGGTTARLQTHWTVDYRPGLDPTLVDVPGARRIVHQGRVYEITAASMVGRQRAIELMTVAKVG